MISRPTFRLRTFKEGIWLNLFVTSICFRITISAEMWQMLFIISSSSSQTQFELISRCFENLLWKNGETKFMQNKLFFDGTLDSRNRVRVARRKTSKKIKYHLPKSMKRSLGIFQVYQRVASKYWSSWSKNHHLLQLQSIQTWSNTFITIAINDIMAWPIFRHNYNNPTNLC